jgi:phosphatidylinositol dimannoside acyltransferase
VTLDSLNVKRFANEVKDAVLLCGVPALAVLLPWRVCFWLFGQLSKSSFFDPLTLGGARSALVHAERHQVSIVPPEWHRRRRFTAIIDHADHYIARFSARRWLHDRVRVTGVWPDAAKPGLAFTFHWGAGMLAQCHLRHHGRVGHMLVDCPQAAEFVGRRIRFRYIQARISRLAAVLGRPVVDARASLKPVLKAIAANELVLAVIDVPTASGPLAQTVNFLGRPSFAPRALFRLAVERQLPVTVYLTGIDFSDGSRTLAIHSLGQFAAVDQLAQTVFAYLDEALVTESAAWHLWSEYHRFFPETSMPPGDAGASVAAENGASTA